MAMIKAKKLKKLIAMFYADKGRLPSIHELRNLMVGRKA